MMWGMATRCVWFIVAVALFGRTSATDAGSCAAHEETAVMIDEFGANRSHCLPLLKADDSSGSRLYAFATCGVNELKDSSKQSAEMDLAKFHCSKLTGFLNGRKLEWSVASVHSDRFKTILDSKDSKAVLKTCTSVGKQTSAKPDSQVLLGLEWDGTEHKWLDKSPNKYILGHVKGVNKAGKEECLYYLKEPGKNVVPWSVTKCRTSANLTGEALWILCSAPADTSAVGAETTNSVQPKAGQNSVSTESAGGAQTSKRMQPKAGQNSAATKRRIKLPHGPLREGDGCSTIFSAWQFTMVVPVLQNLF